METPTREDIQFYGERGDYWKNIFARALAEERITKDDRDLILQFVSEHRAFVGISRGRQNKIVSHLVTWRYWIGPYRENGMGEIAIALSELQTAKSHTTGRLYSLHVRIDFLTILKQFYRWMIEKNLTSITETDLKRIKIPAKPAVTISANELLTTDEIEAFLKASQTPRDWAPLHDTL